MKDANATLSISKETILLKSNTIANLAKLLDSSFTSIVTLSLSLKITTAILTKFTYNIN
ncbi:hypothetical protein [Tenacibaculum sp. 47A_GOM-205m]|uniref:hypothetical protein n=1 Tax=Tenacibaculum sp. 47A_GOM-205m TaxID=1380384 RepID=UPI0012DF1418|nr:hypothetical protein [Tenacibaculum sp. 47A_GOM-205m]